MSNESSSLQHVRRDWLESVVGSRESGQAHASAHKQTNKGKQQKGRTSSRKLAVTQTRACTGSVRCSPASPRCSVYSHMRGRCTTCHPRVGAPAWLSVVFVVCMCTRVHSLHGKIRDLVLLRVLYVHKSRELCKPIFSP